MFIQIFNGLCVQKFEVVQMFSQLQKPLRIRFIVCKIINLKLCFVSKPLSVYFYCT